MARGSQPLAHPAPGRGLIVAELTIKDAEDLLEMLALLDTQGARLAAQRRTSEQAARLIALAQGLCVAAEQQDIDAWYRSDGPYHDTLLDAAGNEFLRRSIEDVRRRLQRITYHLAVQPEHMLSGTREHMELAQAISDADPDRAAEIMRQHLDAMRTMAMKLIRTHIVPIRGERF